MGADEPILQASSVSFAYGQRPAVENVELRLDRGEIVSLLGPNGSGKSTLIKLLLGYLHGRGKITWDGSDLSDWSRRRLGRFVAYLPQQPLIDDAETVAHVLAMGRAPYLGAFGLESASDLAVINSVIEQLKIERQLLHRRLDELSGGQRQRIFIARCLIQQPRALLLDEPTNNLDLRHQLQLLELLRELAHERGMAVLTSAHDVNLAAEFSDRLVLLQNGQKVADGPPGQILRPDLLQSVYGVPMELLERPGRLPIVLPAARQGFAQEPGENRPIISQ